MDAISPGPSSPTEPSSPTPAAESVDADGMDFSGVEITSINEYISEAKSSYLDLPGQRCICIKNLGRESPCKALATQDDKLCDFCRTDCGKSD